MGKVAAALGLGSSLTYKDKVYNISPWTYRIQGEFEKYLERTMMETYKLMAPYMSEQERKEELGKIRKEIVSGEYTFGSDTVAKALGSLPHLTYLLYLMMRVNHPEITVDLAGEIVQAQMGEVMDKMAEANADPSTTTQVVKE